MGETITETLGPNTVPTRVSEATSGGGGGGITTASVESANPVTLPPDRRAILEGQTTTGRLSLARAGWDVFVIGPQGRLVDVWHANRKKLPAGTV